MKIILVLVLLIVFSYAVLNKNREKKTDAEYDYIIVLPKQLKIMCKLMFIAGILFFSIFTICYLKEIGGATIGHLFFSIMFIVIGWGGLAASYRWKVVVKHNGFVWYSVWGAKKEILFSEISIRKGKQGELKFYKKRKKVFTVDSRSCNYEKLKDTFDRNNIHLE